MSSVRVFRPTLASVVFVASTVAPALAWGSASVSVLAIDPRTPTTVYAAMSDGRGVLKSTDGGLTWSVTGPAGVSFFVLKIDPQEPATLYGAAREWFLGDGTLSEPGVYKSTDGGRTWSIVGLAGVQINTLLIDPLTPTTLYASAEWAGVLKSTDGGESWAQTVPGPFMTESLAIDPFTPSTLYAADAFVGDEGFTWYGGVFKTVDGGTTWAATGLASGDFWWVRIDPDVPTTVYAAGIWVIDYQTSGGKGLFKSMDAGATWSLTSSEPCWNQAIDLGTPTTRYCGTDQGVSKSTDGGATWAPANTGLTDTLAAYEEGPGVGSIVIEPVTPGSPHDQQPAVYVVTGIGVFKSTDGGASWKPTGLFQHSPLASVSVDPASVPAGMASTGNVHLATPAPSGGVTVTLSSGNPSVATVPTTVTVPAGMTSATFTVWTSPVTTSASAAIFAANDDATRFSWVSVTPATTGPTLSALDLSPTTLAGGSGSIGSVLLSAVAPSGGAVVALASSDTAVAAVPTNVTVPAGATSATFTISTNPVPATTAVAISATYGGTTRTAVLTVSPPSLSSMSVNPTIVTGGTGSTGTVRLSSPAPASGSVVALSSSIPAVAMIPGSVTVAAGTTSAVFAISTVPVAAASTVSVSASHGGATRTAVLTVTPPTLSAMSLAPTSVIGGAVSIGTVSLSNPAPPGGAIVMLSSANTGVATVPTSVTVPAGVASATFSVSTLACASGTVTISGSYGGVSRSAALSVSTAPDSVAIQIAEYFVKRRSLLIEATSTRPTARLSVFETSSRVFIGDLKRNPAGGRYRGEFAWAADPRNVTVRSDLCGWATRDVTLKYGIGVVLHAF